MGSRTAQDALRDLDGVLYHPADDGDEKSAGALAARKTLLDEGVSFRGVDSGEVPWLVAAEPFPVDEELTGRLRSLGAAIFALSDAVQDLYAEGHPVVRDHLDIGVPDDVRGLDLARTLDLFRLDVVVTDGRPMATELEELIGNVGKMHAFERAYGVSATPLFSAFARRDVTRVWLDDELGSYRPEMALMQRRMKEEFGHDVAVDFFSRFQDDGRKGWRFCYVKDFVQYDATVRERIVAGSETLTNPLFSGYGTKGLLPLCWHEDLADELTRRMGQELLDTVRAGTPQATLLPAAPAPETLNSLREARKRTVLKVMDAPGHPEYTWGSRGVFFGDTAANRWRQVLDAVAAGNIPGRTDAEDVRYIVNSLVDSDRYDIDFLHPREATLCTMPRARVRLGPVFSREPDGPRLLGGHATFVNTSRKAHLGRHAICAPIRLATAATGDAPGAVPGSRP
ncbi:hypothetical protein [Streptomyces gilvosporeus]|uniref:Uncharacterized protein n=1 Tax=Streptomyces gilvosporeus TaxID=553510 RepID=A0A1V0U1P4_9ACTN|nr:hypothetical protein [Streptomyces gilvosporeus]ARF59103.1 hypothetical protein B1H19_37390 [Streptomyces gilvosporeus]